MLLVHLVGLYIVQRSGALEPSRASGRDGMMNDNIFQRECLIGFCFGRTCSPFSSRRYSRTLHVIANLICCHEKLNGLQSNLNEIKRRATLIVII